MLVSFQITVECVTIEFIQLVMSRKFKLVVIGSIKPRLIFRCIINKSSFNIFSVFVKLLNWIWIIYFTIINLFLGCKFSYVVLWFSHMTTQHNFTTMLLDNFFFFLSNCRMTIQVIHFVILNVILIYAKIRLIRAQQNCQKRKRPFPFLLWLIRLDQTRPNVRWIWFSAFDFQTSTNNCLYVGAL